MKYLKLFEQYNETELKKYKGLDINDILEISKDFIEWRRLTTKRPDGLEHKPIEEVERVIVRNDGTIYISWESEEGNTYHHEVFDENIYYKFIENPELYKTSTKYNL